MKERQWCVFDTMMLWALITLTLLLIWRVFFDSSEQENCILPRNDAQMLNGYNQ